MQIGVRPAVVVLPAVLDEGAPETVHRPVLKVLIPVRPGDLDEVGLISGPAAGLGGDLRVDPGAVPVFIDVEKRPQGVHADLQHREGLFALAGLGVRRRGLLAGAQNTRRSQNRQDGRNELFYGLFIQK